MAAKKFETDAPAEETPDAYLARESSVQWVRLGDMRVSPVAQRELKRYKVDEIKADFSIDKVGVPTVSYRDGFYYIVDGQHRVSAMVELGYEDREIQCTVYEELSEEQEADLFLAINNVLAVSVMDKYNVGVVAGVKDAVAVHNITHKLGLHVSLDAKGGSIKAVGTLRKIYNRYGDAVLTRTLKLVNDAYGDAGFKATVIEGTALLLQRYWDRVDDDWFVTRVGSYRGGVSGLLGNAETLRLQTNQAKGICVAAALVTIYNGGGKKPEGVKSLPSWWKAEE